jgi:hypothetical protein
MYVSVINTASRVARSARPGRSWRRWLSAPSSSSEAHVQDAAAADGGAAATGRHGGISKVMSTRGGWRTEKTGNIIEKLTILSRSRRLRGWWSGAAAGRTRRRPGTAGTPAAARRRPAAGARRRPAARAEGTRRCPAAGSLLGSS